MGIANLHQYLKEVNYLFRSVSYTVLHYKTVTEHHMSIQGYALRN